MFVSSEKFIEAHSGKLGDISIYGQESNYTTWRLAKMNLAIRGIDAQIAHGDTFHNDRHPTSRPTMCWPIHPSTTATGAASYSRTTSAGSMEYRLPATPTSRGCSISSTTLHPLDRGFVLANGSMSSNQSNEGEIRKNIIEADLVDCMVALPGQLFYSTQIPVCLWFLARNKKNGRFRDRRGETLFIDARKMGT
jgi:type I restriction enzyme M protein